MNASILQPKHEGRSENPMDTQQALRELAKEKRELDRHEDLAAIDDLEAFRARAVRVLRVVQ